MRARNDRAGPNVAPAHVPSDGARASGWQRVRLGLTWFVGVAFLALGVAEVGVRLLGEDPVDPAAVAFWSVSLLGGGTLVLVGALRVGGRSGRGLLILWFGVMLGSVATMWTLVLPVLAVITFVQWATLGEPKPAR